MEKGFHRIDSPGALHNLDHIWDYYLPYYRIAPHVYGVGGNIDVSVYLLDTGEGLALIDTGMAEFLYLIIDSIYQAGFDPHNIKRIFLSHGHGDHYNGARMLQELSGAEIYMSRIDYDFYRQHPKVPDGCIDTPFQMDHDYRDDLPIQAGRFTIHTRLTPGHTPGTTSFFFEDTDEETGETFHVAMHGGVGANQMKPDYLARMGLPEDLAHRFIRDCEELSRLEVDICLPSHLNQINLAANLPENPRDYRPMVDKTVWPSLLLERAAAIKSFYPEVYGK